MPYVSWEAHPILPNLGGVKRVRSGCHYDRTPASATSCYRLSGGSVEQEQKSVPNAPCQELAHWQVNTWMNPHTDREGPYLHNCAEPFQSLTVQLELKEASNAPENKKLRANWARAKP
ncbi:hypothetical protein SKAU_G00318940 [Synaphobranchus kaupii]|uniref:Uncharacterized protein n=1 Tax=Synaphobranchus kaupii TaxID=118154 RepID=A0A9Q1ET53_SYNKA|nr:hypothetical protein SKAU_G00318940 [Synaphobranchus kaupii]